MVLLVADSGPEWLAAVDRVSIPAGLSKDTTVAYVELVTREQTVSVVDCAADRMAADDECLSYQAVLEFIGRRWTGAVLLAGPGARRFGRYRALVPGISDRLLSQRLKELEAFGLVRREVVSPPPCRSGITSRRGGPSWSGPCSR